MEVERYDPDSLNNFPAPMIKAISILHGIPIAASVKQQRTALFYAHDVKNEIE